MPAAVIYVVLFLVPTLLVVLLQPHPLDLFTSTFIGFDNYETFFQEPALVTGCATP